MYIPPQVQVQASIEVRGFALLVGSRYRVGRPAEPEAADVVTDKWYCGSVGELASSKPKSKYS